MNDKDSNTIDSDNDNDDDNIEQDNDDNNKLVPIRNNMILKTVSSTFKDILVFRARIHCINCISFNVAMAQGVLIIPFAQRSWRGVFWFHPVRLSVRPSVRPSVCPSTRLWRE